MGAIHRSRQLFEPNEPTHHPRGVWARLRITCSPVSLLQLVNGGVELVPEPAPGVEGDEVGAGLEGGAAGRVAVAPRDVEVLGALSPGGVPIAGLEGGLKSMEEERLM